jgi:hypothetical protein
MCAKSTQAAEDYSLPWEMELFTVPVPSVIKRLPISLSFTEESMAGHVGVKGAY